MEMNQHNLFFNGSAACVCAAYRGPIYEVQQPYEKLASVFTGVLPPLCLVL